jgi:hypothetical protein
MITVSVFNGHFNSVPSNRHISICSLIFFFSQGATSAGDTPLKEKNKKGGPKAIHLNAMSAHNIIASIYEAKVIGRLPYNSIF